MAPRSDRLICTTREPFATGSIGRIAPSMALTIRAHSPIPTESAVTMMRLAIGVLSNRRRPRRRSLKIAWLTCSALLGEQLMAGSGYRYDPAASSSEQAKCQSRAAKLGVQGRVFSRHVTGVALAIPVSGHGGPIAAHRLAA